MSLIPKYRYKVRMYYEVLGGHTHVRVFAGVVNAGALGKCGDLTFTNEEWEAYKEATPEQQAVNDAAAASPPLIRKTVTDLLVSQPTKEK